MPELKLKFDRHGLGDCVHFAHALQLYKRRGFDVTVQVEENKLFVWKLAGVNVVQGGDLPDHPYIYPHAFEDLNAPDHDQNKIAFGLRHDVMPKLEEWSRADGEGPRDPDVGCAKSSERTSNAADDMVCSEHSTHPTNETQERIWDELCAVQLSAHDHIPPEAHAEVEAFLAGLPRPIICFHSRGTNWHERKSIPTEVAFEVILKLLDQTGGSVIVLDFDRRAPMVGDARCKGIKPSWGHIGVDRLCALYERCDLMIGVDSGPFHVASLTPIKALGVFSSLHPTRVCLPNPNAVYLVGEQHRAALASRDGRWSFAFYPGAEPTADDVADTAVRMLNGVTQAPLTKVENVQANRAEIAGRYEYHRVGHDRRPLELRPDGTIGEGNGDCERKWFFKHDQDKQTLFITGKHGVICQCERGDDGTFRGRWTQFERMRIEITKIGEVVPALARGLTPPAQEEFAISPDRIRLVMNWDDAFDELAAITAPNRREYAARHGYQIAESHFAGAWGKIDALLQNWDQADWLFWLDSDAIVTNLDQKLEDFIEEGIDIVVSHDRNGLTSGSMFIRTDSQIKAILEDLLRRREEFDIPDGCYEQTGLSRLLWKIADRVRVLPKRRLDSYPARYYPEIPANEGWHREDFAMHVPALPLAKRVQILRDTLINVSGTAQAVRWGMSNEG